MLHTMDIRWELLALFGGVLFSFSFAPFDLPYLSIVSLIILFSCWQEATPCRAAFRGYLFGLGLFGAGVSWVYISIHDYGGAGVVSSALITFLFFGFWALFPALTGYISVKLIPASSVYIKLFLIPSVWILIEYLRGQWIFNGFPWLQIAYSQLDTPLAGYIPLFGAYGTGMMAVLSASLLFFLLNRKGNVLILSSALISIWLVGSLLRQINWTHPIGNPIKVSLIQGNISQDKKWLPENRNKTLDLYRQLTRENWDSQLIIWPESAIPAYLHLIQDDFLFPLEQEAIKHNTELVVSLPVKESRDKKYNAVMSFGRQRGIYRKIHLLPFGEYLPLQPFSNLILNSLNILPIGSFAAGEKDQQLLTAAGYPFITTICYEDAFSEEGVNRLSEAAFLVNVTNDAWFGDTIEPYQHMQIARMRALETGRYLLRATNTGVTAFVAPDGSIVHQAPLFKETVLTAEVLPMAGLTPYARNSDTSTITIMVILFIGLNIYSRLNWNKNE